MCGITGIYNYKTKQPSDRILARQMVNAISHRGPDDEGFFYSDEHGVFLGHRRLSIIDLSSGHQPMTNENETVWVVYNGEIYNFTELRKELVSKGHFFKTNSDTEVIVHSYEEWGINGFKKLNGMFDFALWDGKKKTIILARDPFGIKPLYYSDTGSSLVFGSEIKPLLIHPEVQRKPDINGIYNFITYTYVPSPNTVFENVFKIPPGYCLQVNNSGSKLIRFYDVLPSKVDTVNENELIEELRLKIYSAIKRQMISDVPIGAMLSGGVDSSTVAAIMSRISASPVKTFTVGFSGNYRLNELEEAKYFSQLIGSEHHELIITPQDYSDLLSFSVWHMEEPVSTGSIIAYYLICKLAREHVKVVLTGQGADEPFAGYPRHTGEQFGKYYRKIPSVIRNGIITPLAGLLPRNERIKRAVNSLSDPDELSRFKSVYETIDRRTREELFVGGYFNESLMRVAVDMWLDDVEEFDSLNKMLYVDSRLSLPDNLLLYGDKMAMAVSLEARVPFLDLELMNFVEGISSKFKIKGSKQKFILKAAVKKWVPDEIITRKKIGFTTPIDEWFQGEFRIKIEQQLLSEGSASRQFFNKDKIFQMIKDHELKRQDYKRPLLSLLTFEIWYQQFIEPSDEEFTRRVGNI